MNIETRSVEESLLHARDGISRAEGLVRLILDDLNGSGPETDQAEASVWGLVSTADVLAGRIESLVGDLQRVRSRLVSNSPKSIATLENEKAQMTGPRTAY